LSSSGKANGKAIFKTTIARDGVDVYNLSFDVTGDYYDDSYGKFTFENNNLNGVVEYLRANLNTINGIREPRN